MFINFRNLHFIYQSFLKKTVQTRAEQKIEDKEKISISVHELERLVCEPHRIVSLKLKSNLRKFVTNLY